jgi:hypothetical protein
MNAPLSILARLAIQAGPTGYLADDDTLVQVPNQWHQSHVDARQLGTMPPAPVQRTDTQRQLGRQVLSSAVEACRAATRSAQQRTTRAPSMALTCWRETPRNHRRILARLAGLSFDVADKSDRDLTEDEKAQLRAAARELLDGIGGLAASL